MSRGVSGDTSRDPQQFVKREAWQGKNTIPIQNFKLPPGPKRRELRGTRTIGDASRSNSPAFNLATPGGLEWDPIQHFKASMAGLSQILMKNSGLGCW
jgi:hypothetical protein